MKTTSVTFSLDQRKWLYFLALAALIALVLVGLPFLIDLWNRAIDWFIGLFPHRVRLWEDFLWLR